MNSSGGRKRKTPGPRGRRAPRPREQDRDVQLSKALSYPLRHGALKLGLLIGPDGFVSLDTLLQLPQFRGFSFEDVQRMVDTNGKQRFALQPGDPKSGPLIRANQGHSLQVPELELNTADPVPGAGPWNFPEALAIHPAARAVLPGKDAHPPGLRIAGDPGVVSGMRLNYEVAVFIDGPRALAEGIQFFRSANGVILTPGNANGLLLPKYLKEAWQLCPTRKPLSLAGDTESTPSATAPE